VNGYIEIDDIKAYKRCRVQLHAQGIVLRDTLCGADIKTKKQQVCRANEFLVAEIDAKVGGFGIVPDDLDGAIVSSHYFLFQVNEMKLIPRFLGYYIKTLAFREQVEAQGSTNYAAIRPRDVLKYRIRLPAMEEQQKVIAIVEMIEEVKRIHAFVGKELVATIPSLLSSSAHGALPN
jgi:type I restriction enzyme, S subunit